MPKIQTVRYVISPFYPVADNLDVSHRAGWARYWTKELEAELLTTKTMDKLETIEPTSEVYLYHGMEWTGQLNLQSGLTQDVENRAMRLVHATKRKVTVVSLDCAMPAYGTLLAQRGYTEGKSLDHALKTAPCLLVPSRSPRRLILGDSHSLSLYRPNSVICRIDGKTLHGMLQYGLVKYLDSWIESVKIDFKRLECLTCYFGNIDIRHHLLRQMDSRLATMTLIKTYVQQLKAVQTRWKIKQVEVAMPLPIENESRVLPKTGWYRGTPFFGSWIERTRLRCYFIDRLKFEASAHGIDIYEHPDHFTNSAGELSFDVMERPRSVHIRPSEYRLIHEGLKW